MCKYYLKQKIKIKKCMKINNSADAINYKENNGNKEAIKKFYLDGKPKINCQELR